LIFQTLDSKNECVGFYANGKLSFEKPHGEFTATWNYAPYLSEDVDFVSLYASGRKLKEVCPPELDEEYRRTARKLKSYLRSFNLAKIDLSDSCFFDLVPRRFLLEYYSVRNKITEHVLQTHTRPKNYDFLLEMTKIAYDVKSAKLNLDYSQFAKFPNNHKTKAFYKKLLKTNPYIIYNIFGTVTGRLTVNKESFPILTFPKNYRSILKPNNDRFVEFDFNAAELRTLLSLSGVEQPTEDIHNWIVKNVFKNAISREESKIKTFAWLYNPEAENLKLEKVFNKKKLVGQYWKEGVVVNPFGRVMKCDQRLALNYLIQSTTSDMFLNQMIKVNALVKDKKSYIAFSMHDSLIIDFNKEDKKLVSQVHSLFSDTKLGTYKANISVGRDYGSMIKMNF